MQERRRDDRSIRELSRRITLLEAAIEELSKRPNGKTDEEIMDVLRKEVGAGTIAFLAKMAVWVCGTAGAAILTYLGIKGVSAK